MPPLDAFADPSTADDILNFARHVADDNRRRSHDTKGGREPVIEQDLSIDTSRDSVLDVTDLAMRFAADAGCDGLMNVFVPHATAGIALIETGSGSEADLTAALERLLPRNARYAHRHGSAGHGADHLLPALVSPSITIPVRSGRLRLGTWQRIVVVDLNADNPRRTLRLSLLSG